MDHLFQLNFQVKQACLLRDFLYMNHISKRTLTAVKYGGGKLYVNQIERDVRHPLQCGDDVKVIFPPEAPSEGLIAESGPLSIVYEDETLLLIDKPFGMKTIPSYQERRGTIANYVAGRFLSHSIPSTVHVVTRLDHNTSGLLCIAKNRHIHHLLNKQIKALTFERTYEAIVEGHLQKDAMKVELPIGRKEGSIIERTICEKGQQAVTNVRVIRRFHINDQPFTYLSIQLETGRTHQIRVHMRALGHPLAGDLLYGGKVDFIKRQALHCSTLSFQHPIEKENVQFRSNLPEDMNDMLIVRTKHEYE